MTELQLIGLGAWSPNFSNWDEFCEGLATGKWPEGGALQPGLIPPRERRRAPQFVKMAIEVMDQACRMAALEPDEIAVVFSSMMGDMQITDYMCTALAQDTKLLSPTKFHNSVHNAAPGYWSITTGAFSPASAISAFHHTAPMALLEACIQAVEEDTPVLCVTEELSAPLALAHSCQSVTPFAAALLVAPRHHRESPIARIWVELHKGSVIWPELDDRFHDFVGNVSAQLLPIMSMLAKNERGTLRFPTTRELHIEVQLESCTT